MKGNLRLYYDEEGDFLEIGIDKPSNGYFRDLGDEVFERVDEKTGEVKGIAIFNFKKRTEKLKEVELSLPFKIELSV